MANPTIRIENPSSRAANRVSSHAHSFSRSRSPNILSYRRDMSKMRFDGKPPLAKSPIRLRSRAVLRSNPAVSRSLQTPPGSLTKSKKLASRWDADEMDLGPGYYSVSCELRSLTRMADEDLVKAADSAEPGFGANLTATPVSMFERGRFYDLYSARRNERLRRKRGETADEKKNGFGLGVTVESAKRKDSKKLESLRKSVCSAYSVVGRNETPAPRYLLRSSVKENKKPPVGSVFVASALNTEKRIGVRRVKKY
ncbi:hypothetical protein MLD38_002171 [Melastoma candidum]|uniref:Uncharacterized protein n=1 Tax=Melastoma candidum TaxID=119954 RepID=A0ACB9SFI1_9MYRT|nr:hypothetical protein MLD38_002171 [Melastoma candidum]